MRQLLRAHVGGQHLELPAQRIGDLLAAALVRHVGDLATRGTQYRFQHAVAHGARARGGPAQALGPAGGGQQCREVVTRQGRGAGHQHRRGHHAHHRRQLRPQRHGARGIGLGAGQRADGREHQHLPVGRRARQRGQRQRTAGAGPVFHQHRHAQARRQRLGQQPRRRIADAAGRIGHHQVQRPGRPALAQGRARPQRGQATGQRRGAPGQQLAAPQQVQPMVASAPFTRPG